MKPKQAFASLLVGASLFLLISCASHPDTSTKSPWISITLQLTGSEGAPFSGYYSVRGKKVPVSGNIPKTITDFEITGCEFRKGNLQDSLQLLIRDGSSTLNFGAPPGTVGVKADLSGGWNAQVIRK